MVTLLADMAGAYFTLFLGPGEYGLSRKRRHRGSSITRGWIYSGCLHRHPNILTVRSKARSYHSLGQTTGLRSRMQLHSVEQYGHKTTLGVEKKPSVPAPEFAIILGTYLCCVDQKRGRGLSASSKSSVTVGMPLSLGRGRRLPTSDLQARAGFVISKPHPCVLCRLQSPSHCSYASPVRGNNTV